MESPKNVSITPPGLFTRFCSVFLLFLSIYVGIIAVGWTLALPIMIIMAIVKGTGTIFGSSIMSFIMVFLLVACVDALAVFLIKKRKKLRKRIVEWKGPEKIKQEKENKKIALICVAIAIVMLGGAFLFANYGPRESNQPKTREEIFEIMEDLYPDEKETETWDITITFD